MDRQRLISMLMDNQRAMFAEEPESADFEAAEQHYRTLTTAQLQQEVDDLNAR